MTDPKDGSPLPPAVTQWTVNGTGDRGAAPVPPFSPGASVPAVPAAAPAPQLDAPVLMPWDIGGETSDDGVVEPMFEEDVAATTEEILANAQASREEFPVDAFIIPEDTRRVPTGLSAGVVEAAKSHMYDKPDTAHELADRFEKLSRRLRNEEVDTLLPSLMRGDRFDSLLAGFLAGYFSARDA
jgi:hypothetical protein